MTMHYELKGKHDVCFKANIWLTGQVNIVNSGWPSSGWERFLPVIAAANRSSRLDAGPPSRSPLSRHGHRRRDGSPSGDVSAPPALSLRGCGATALNWPPSAGRRQEVSFPSLVTPVADEGEFKNVVLRWSKWSVPNCVRPSDVARGLAWDPLTLAWDRSSIPSRYLIDWCVCPKTYLESRWKSPPYALIDYNKLPPLTN